MINNGPKEIEITTEMSLRYFNPISLMEEYSNAVVDPSFTIRKTSQPLEVKFLKKVFHLHGITIKFHVLTITGKRRM